ncbi:MAG: tyrosine-type recombinase/integrase [Methanobacteriaceae archaeon]
MISTDIKVKKMFVRKDLSDSRKKQYIGILGEVYNLFGKTPSELILEAKEEEQPYIINGVPRIKDIEDRKVTNYFYSYYEYLMARNLNNSTVDFKLKSLRAFYREHDIMLPKPIKINVPFKVIREGDIPNINDIKTAVDNSSIRNKALLLFMASTGIRSSDIRNFKVSDFTKATNDYHNGNSVEDLIDGNYKDVVPCWDFTPIKTRKAGNICMTFNTPEATEAITNYLKTRDNLQEDDYLFLSQYKTQLGPRSLIWMYKELNDKFFHRTSDGHRFFHAHSMRKFFISTVKHYTSDYKKGKILSGHAVSRIETAYEEIKKSLMKEFYVQLIPYLSIRDTKVYTIKSEKYLELEKELEVEKLKNS